VPEQQVRQIVVEGEMDWRPKIGFKIRTMERMNDIFSMLLVA
jgi:hypothetical protein